LRARRPARRYPAISGEFRPEGSSRAGLPLGELAQVAGGTADQQRQHHGRDRQPDDVEDGELDVGDDEVEPGAERDDRIERDWDQPHLGGPIRP
jgi:hypothetical protein